MLRQALIASAAAAMLLVTFTPDDASARGGRGAGVRAGGYHGGAVRAGGYRGGAVAARGYRGAYAGYRGYRYGVGAAAVGAAAVGAAATGAYYRSGCGYDAYGNYVCPGGYSPY